MALPGARGDGGDGGRPRSHEAIVKFFAGAYKCPVTIYRQMQHLGLRYYA